ncbi:MAG: hypothetical protein J0H19_24075 [Rhodospirillales bacterium]|nr:hypothetical protein [Rhodospirillales bacterium]
MRKFILAVVMAFCAARAHAETMIVAMPANMSSSVQEEASAFMGRVYQDLKPNDVLIVFDASRERPVATLRMPDHIGTGRRDRIRALGPAAGQIMDFITGTAPDAKPDNLNIPATLREIGATIMPEVKEAKILLIGSLFYDDPRNANFTTKEFLPSDGFLTQNVRGGFSVIGQEALLKGALVSICYTDPGSAFQTEAFRQSTVEFWGKSIVGRGGKVGSIQEYSRACAARLRSDVVDPAEYKIDYTAKLFLMKQHWVKVDVR